MTPKQFEKFIQRDRACYHCGGRAAGTWVPQHRKNRGMGGSKKLRDDPNNIIVFCSEANQRLESDAAFATIGIKFGWKLESWEDLSKPVFDAATGIWWRLEGMSRIQIPKEPDDEAWF